MPETAAVREEEREMQPTVVEVKVGPQLEDFAFPSYFTISKSLNQQVKWVAADGTTPFTIEFKKDSPFYEKQFSNDFPYSGIIRRNVLGDPNRKYEYSVSIGSQTRDPGGVINP